MGWWIAVAVIYAVINVWFIGRLFWPLLRTQPNPRPVDGLTTSWDDTTQSWLPPAPAPPGKGSEA